MESRYGRSNPPKEQTWIHLLELDPCIGRDDTRPQPRLEAYHKTKIRGSLDARVKETRSVSQKKRRFGEEKRRAAEEEKSKLLQARFIREVKYPKAQRKWRMCTNYTALNKACPKDSYPLPIIDTLVDGASGCGLLSLMDTYLIFKNHIGHQVEVYVDDMVVKSDVEEKHTKSLESIFTVLRTHQLKLNLDTCLFGVRARKFLGFMLAKRGIKVNPEKCSVIINMRSPKSVKESHPMIIRIDLLIRQILRKLNLVGRMTGWAVELLEFDITFERRGHVKVQMLTDSINELTPNPYTEEING
ncbi:Retrovirus-related Pol polyprotein from transposon opus, partial [Mucuna pruriens]